MIEITKFLQGRLKGRLPGKKQLPQPPEPVGMEQLLTMAQLIAGEQSAVAQQVARCAKQPADYFEQHRQQYLERGVTQPCQPETLCLLALADQLIAAGLAYELDWKVEKEDFLFFVRKLADGQNPDLPLCLDWFEEHQNRADWVEKVNESWAASGYYLAQLAIDSDSMTLFCVPLELLARLRQAAPQGVY